ncbi:ERF family protein [Vagococcus lutrae]|uniref:ERF family protein n=1 Tax=Vagococcus lutrae TaxID=81947 RepID=UPI0025B7772F|nr:ERF family protein [Vagococcus lutrae]
MKMSEGVDELFNGMFLLKSKLKQPKFDSSVDYRTKKGDRTKFEYATLKAIEEAIRKAAQTSESGIDFQQEVINENNNLSVNTIIYHKSGQWVLHGPFTFPTSGQNPQGLGSLSTYARRYALSAAFGIAADKDDDGQAANETQKERQKNTQPTQSDNQKEIETLIEKYRTYLLENNRDLNELNQYIIKKENVARIEQVDRVRVMGYYKAFAMKQKETNETIAQQPAQESTQQPVQTELDGIRWGQRK